VSRIIRDARELGESRETDTETGPSVIHSEKLLGPVVFAASSRTPSRPLRSNEGPPQTETNAMDDIFKDFSIVGFVIGLLDELSATAH